MAGMHGAIGSMDAFHIVIEKRSHRLKQMHLGGKSKQTCRSFNLTCNHRRESLHTTCGHPDQWNDKTIVLYDELARGLKNGELLTDNTFELFERGATGDIIKVKYCGAWLVVDNGYLNWGVTIPPIKRTMYITDTRWSEWLESMRKGVECTFGILKGRFRMLKAGIRIHGFHAADDIWMTCCALHNMLLSVDGLTEEWAGHEGKFDFDPQSERVPLALQRLANPNEQRSYDTSGMGSGFNNLVDNEEIENGDDSANIHLNILEEEVDRVSTVGISYVNNLSADVLQQKLIEHFDILFKQHKVVWPRNKNK